MRGKEPKPPIEEPSVLIGSTWGPNHSGSDNVAIGYKAGTHYVGSSLSTPWPEAEQTQDDAPATWTCAYCDRENHGDRLTCAGCQAGRPREADEESMEIRVFGGDSVTVHQQRPPLHPVDRGARK